jgi:hypothetical protein
MRSRSVGAADVAGVSELYIGRRTRASDEGGPTMKRFFTRRLAVAAGLLAGVAAAIGGGVAIAAGADDDATDRPISGAALVRAEAAALAYTGGGRVTETEVGDEESRYELEVTLPNGDQVDVQLDASFVVVGAEGDGHDEDD